MIAKGSTVLVTGGAGYVGAVLVPRLLKEGYKVKVVDLYIFGDDVLEHVKDDPGLEQIRGDIRDQELLSRILPGCDAVIHLACISNDPCFELNPELSKSINFDCFEPLVSISKSSGVKRFIYASTSSVYGVSDAPEVDEEHPLLPITDYNKYKGLCEPILQRYQSPEFTTVTIRPATVCGYSPRQRLDLTVNILTNFAYNKGSITIFGGEQQRPNIHIEDMVDLYVLLLELPAEKIAGRTFNAGYQNQKVKEIADIVKKMTESAYPDKNIELLTVPSEDIRSYHISSRKIQKELGFTPKRTIENAVEDLIEAFKADKLPNSFDDPKYFNIKAMQKCGLS
ncbi:MAG: NAD-dependent epimerase/dehydratase [Candidatus Melainabacteria bacterium]|nr:NAD-dependent epimerase/dehydratase [Candidatus Melainabacteria bacterium]